MTLLFGISIKPSTLLSEASRRRSVCLSVCELCDCRVSRYPRGLQSCGIIDSWSRTRTLMSVRLPAFSHSSLLSSFNRKHSLFKLNRASFFLTIASETKSSSELLTRWYHGSLFLGVDFSPFVANAATHLCVMHLLAYLTHPTHPSFISQYYIAANLITVLRNLVFKIVTMKSSFFTIWNFIVTLY